MTITPAVGASSAPPTDLGILSEFAHLSGGANGSLRTTREWTDVRKLQHQVLTSPARLTGSARRPACEATAPAHHHEDERDCPDARSAIGSTMSRGKPLHICCGATLRPHLARLPWTHRPSLVQLNGSRISPDVRSTQHARVSSRVRRRQLSLRPSLVQCHGPHTSSHAG